MENPNIIVNSWGNKSCTQYEWRVILLSLNLVLTPAILLLEGLNELRGHLQWDLCVEKVQMSQFLFSRHYSAL